MIYRIISISNTNSTTYKIDDWRGQDEAYVTLFQLYLIKRKIKLALKAEYKYFNIINKKMWEASSRVWV